MSSGSDLQQPPDLLAGVHVLAVRHGQTSWNAEHRWQGWADVDLDEEGVRQAERAAARLLDLLAGCRTVGQTAGRPIVVVSSDLLRARHTAAVVASVLGVEVADTLPDLRERNIGDWSGHTTAEIEARWPGQLDAWRRAELRSIPGGEDETGLTTRVSSALESLVRRAVDDGSIVIAVTHGGVIRTLLDRFGGSARPVPNLGAAGFAARDGATRHVVDVDLCDVGLTGPAGTAL